METPLSINLIASDPTIRNGRPLIAGTGICVSDIVLAMLFHERTPDEIASDFGINLAQVYAALAFYYEHKDQIDEEIRQRRVKDAEVKDKQVGSRHSLVFR